VGLGGRINNEGIVGNTGLSALTAGGGSTVVNTRIATVNGSLAFGATGTGVVNVLDNRGAFNASVASLGALDLSNIFTGIEAGTITGNISSVGPSRIVNTGAAATIQGTITLGAGDDSISNSGVILGDIALGDGAGTVTNEATGQITGNLTSGGNTTIANAGIFTGNIVLGAGSDTITNTGLIDGNIDMGAGTNVIGFGSSAAQPTGTLTADAAGTNTVNLFGAGADTLDIEVTNFDVLNKDGTGSWELTRAVALSDRININEGALIASDADWLAGNRIVNNAALVFSNLSDGVFAGAIEGAGAVGIGGAGAAVTTFSGANVYSGGTLIADGTLRVIGGAALLDTGAVVIGALGTLDVAGAETIGDLSGDGLVTLSGGDLSVSSGAFAGSITGANGLTKVGSGTLTLSGVNDFAGPATVAGGTLVLDGGAAIADTTDVAVASGATLSVAAAEGFGSLTGDGAVVLNAGVTVGLDDGSSTFAGVISGAGSLTKAGTGTLTLTGANVYSGGTIVDGGTLAGAAGPIQGDVLVNVAGTLRFEQAVDGSYAGALSGDGVVAKAGAGVLTLTGTNTGHAGQFNLDGGAVSIASEANIGTGVLSFSGATLITTGPTVLLNDVTLNAAGGSFETRDLTALAGVISGPGGLTKTGAGTLLLVGANSYAGGTTVSAGTLAGDTISLQGAISVADVATVEFAQGADGTYAGDLSGAGTLRKTGAGTLTLAGTNSGHSGLTSLDAGAISIGAASNLGTGTVRMAGGTLITTGAMTLANAFTLEPVGGTFQADADTVLSGVVSGAGGLNKTGLGVLTLAGANSFTGAATVAEGTLRLTGGAALADAGAVVVQALGTLDVAAAETIGDLTGDGLVSLSGGVLSVNSGAFAGTITGANGLTKVGAGTLTLSGVNDFAGAATVAAGTLVLDGGAAIADTTDVVVNTGGTLRIAAAEGFGGLSGDGAVVLDAGATVGLDDGDSTFAGVISGVGALTKAGAGTLTLTGANSYSGGTIVDGGTLAGAAGPIQGDVLVNAAGTLRFEQPVDGSYAGALSGDGAVVKAGAGVLTLTGANGAHAGAFDITGGAVAISSEANLGTGTLGLAGGTLITTGPTVLANLVTLNAPGGTFETRDLTVLGGAISGAGQLTKTGAGTLVLVGANSYSGGTTVSTGTLVGDSISLQGAIAVAAGATVNFAEDAGGTFAGALSGAGTVVKSGAGVLTLTGVNTAHTGTLAIDSGTVSIGAASNIGTGVVQMTGGTLATTGAMTLANAFTLNAPGGTFEAQADTVLSGVVSGAGALTKTGAGVLTLAGANSYSGGTDIFEGVLRVTGGAAIADGTLVAILPTGTLDVAAAETIGGLSGQGAVTLSGGDLTVGDMTLGDSVYSGAISGSFGLTKIGTSNLRLSGVNSFTGPLTVNGGTVSLLSAASTALGNTTAVVVNAGGILDVARDEDFGSLSGSGSVVLASTATVGLDNGSSTFAGVIAGIGTLRKGGTGTLTLTGANIYNGGTVVDAGTLAGAAGAIQGVVLVNAAGTLRFEQAAAGTYDGTLFGTGTVVKAGAGVLTLTGDNSGHTGALNVDAGAVSVATAVNMTAGQVTLTGTTLTTTGAVTLANGFTLAGAGGTFETLADTTLSGAIDGTGALTKTGSANLILTGVSSYTGGTVISAGTLTTASGAIQGPVTNNAALVFDEAGAGVFAGNVAGTGSLTKAGAGTLTLTGTSSYTGATSVAAGTLVTGPGGIGDASAVTVAAGATLQLAANETVGSVAGAGALDTAGFTLTAGGNNGSTSVSGPVTGTGVTKAGTGTMTLAGPVTLAGALTAGAGRLEVAGPATVGSAQVSGGTLAVLGTLSGPVTVTTGTADIAAAGSVTGALSTAAAGIAVLNGTVTGDVSNAGTLRGTGRIVGTLSNLGTLTPGNSPGIITVDGAFTQGSTGTLTAELTTVATAGTGYDQVRVTGTPGTATLGGTLVLTPASGLYTAGATYDVILADGGITGDFATITGNVLSPFLSFADTGVVTVAGTQQAYRLTVARTSYAAGLGAGATPNQIAVANGVQGGVAGATGDFATVVTTLDNMTAAEASSFFDQASPEFYGAFATSLVDQGDLFFAQIDRRLEEKPGAAPFALWANFYGQTAKGDNDDYRFGADRDLWGLAGGADYSVDEFSVGVALGWSSASLDYDLGNAEGDSDSWQIGAYARYGASAFDVTLKLGYIDGAFDAERVIAAGGIARSATADFGGSLFQIAAEAGYNLGGDDWRIRPFVGIDVASGKVESFSETGADSLSLDVGSIKADTTRLGLGIDIAKESGNFTPYGRLAYRHEISGGERDVSAAFSGAAGTDFTVEGRAPGGSGVDIDAGVRFRIGENGSLFGGYQGRIRSDLSSHGGNVGVRFSF
jgi:fibronectin-binding autotransporter adhesin